jgi:tetratricopeptide (TPR) repeat protein
MKEKSNRCLRFVLVVIIVNCQLSIVNYSIAQTNYPSEYKNAKLLYEQGKYNLAMEVFKKLIPYDQANPFSEYASFYYAIAAYKQKYYSVSKNMLNQIKTLYPNWEKIDEVNYWLAINHFESGDSFQAMKILSAIKDRKLRDEVAKTERHYLATIADAETLRMLLDEHPANESIAKVLATTLANTSLTAEEEKELEKLIDKYNLKKSDFIAEKPQSYFKKAYSVAVLFPFVVNTLDPTPSKKRNQFVLDIYQGIQLANDSLEKQGITISVRAYDTERSAERLKAILDTDELKNSDLIIGPVWREDNKQLQEFSKQYKINTINPVSNDAEMIQDNPYGFLMQPSYEMIGQKSAQYVAGIAEAKKKCLVFYGSNVRDSVLAWNFITKAEQAGIKIILKQEVFREESNKITEVLATPTEYDEWKAPKQFTIPKDSIGVIFVASDDPIIYTKVVSAVETRKDKTLVIGSESWIENGSVDIEKFQRLNFVLFAPTYTPSTSMAYKNFNKQFIKKYGRTPGSLSNNFAKIGYELMLFVGQSLHKYGVYMQEGLNKEVQKGTLTSDFDFRNSNCNQSVPFIKFIEGSLDLAGKF